MPLQTRDEGKAQAAQIVRRCTMRADVALIEELSTLPREEALVSVLEADIDTEKAAKTDSSDPTLEWWFGRIKNRSRTLQDRMAFFWHSIIPTNRHAAGEHEFIAIQLNLLRANALGNFRELLHELVVDAALLKYLDADNSRAGKVNENLARELMELFTVGVGHYTEADVRAAARAMTGWRVDKDNHTVTRDLERVDTEAVTFMGETANWDVHSIVDRLCDHPATAARIASMIWYHFTGKVLSGDARAELGTWWREQNLDVMPLLNRVMRSEAFWADHYARPRTGFEFYTALMGVLDYDPSETWRPRSLGQLPYEPPNVGGWPIGDRWLSSDSVLRRAEQVFSVDLEKARPHANTATTDILLDAAGLWVVSDETRAALDGLANNDLYEDGVSQLGWRVVLTSPEFQLQ